MSLSVPDVAAQRAQLWAAGFRPIPIFNHDATVTSPGKQPLGNAWQKDAREDPPFCVRSPAVAHALNTGILCDGLRAIDIDIDDPDVARRCRSIVLDRFGEAPVRWRRNSPRCLILYRAAEGEPPKVLIVGDVGKVEVLGRGNQFVAFGQHPTGAELEWFPDAPGEETLDRLKTITEAEVHALLTDLAAIIGAKPPGHINGHDHEPGEPQADPLRIGAALASIANSDAPDWEWWNRIGMATWRATDGSPAGFAMWDAWSARNRAYDATATRQRWDHYATSPPTSLGAGTIFHLARPEPEAPPDESHDPGWWHSLEQSLESGAEVAEVGPGSDEATSAEPMDGRIIDPTKDWLAAAPLREWIVDGWIPRGYVTGLYGDGGIGKSLIIQQLLTSVASSLPWLGLPTRGGRAFGFMCEDDSKELHRRQEAINRAMGLKMPNLENLRFASRYGFDNILMTFDQSNRGNPTELFAQLAKFLTDLPPGPRPTLIALDTLSDIFGGNEIVRSHARQFVQGIGGQLARQFNCGVVIAAHPSASGLSTGSGSGGSTAWSNTFRSRLYMTRPEEDDADEDIRHLSRMKANYAPKGGEIALRWIEGAFLPEGSAPAYVHRIEWDQIGQIFAEIERAWKEGDPWSAAPQTKKDGRYLPLWASVTFGLHERMVASYLDKWLAGGYLRSEIYDQRTKRRGLRVLRLLQPEVAAEVAAEV